MAVTLAFDVYGTLIDTHGLVSALEKMIGSGAEEFSRIWREKQLEYSFRRGGAIPFCRIMGKLLKSLTFFHSNRPFSSI